MGALALASVYATFAPGKAFGQASVLRGSEAQSLINTAFEADGRAARVEISPNRVFPACATALEVKTEAPGRVELRCPATGWARSFRIAESVDDASEARQVAAKGALALRVSLARGTVLSADHLILDTGAEGRSTGTLHNLEAAIGRRLRVNLGRGQPL
ncbi:MAG: SAF domain-containing protein, partial [Pseudomonadota bacterium]